MRGAQDAELTHLDSAGEARMVDISEKPATARRARASADVVMSPEAFAAAARGDLPKGDLTAVVRLSGIMAAKRTAELIPFCHPLQITHVDVAATLDDSLPGVHIESEVACTDRTGVEMEALTACAVAGLTTIDMVKALDPFAHIEGLQVLSKEGGSSGRRDRPPRSRGEVRTGLPSGASARPAGRGRGAGRD